MWVEMVHLSAYLGNLNISGCTQLKLMIFKGQLYEQIEFGSKLP